jgi:hypothetical protein
LSLDDETPQPSSRGRVALSCFGLFSRGREAPRWPEPARTRPEPARTRPQKDKIPASTGGTHRTHTRRQTSPMWRGPPTGALKDAFHPQHSSCESIWNVSKGARRHATPRCRDRTAASHSSFDRSRRSQRRFLGLTALHVFLTGERRSLRPSSAHVKPSDHGSRST